MTKEEKQLLLKDLCARLPYEVKALTPWKKDGPGLVTLIDITSNRQVRVFEDWYDIEEVKPYLRPMSSMTEEEKENLQSLHNIISDENYGDGYSPSAWDAITEWEDYCNSKHLDYRGLIEKGLALEAPEGMYKI